MNHPIGDSIASSSASAQQESSEFSDLTAQIESFVRTAGTDEDKITNNIEPFKSSPSTSSDQPPPVNVRKPKSSQSLKTEHKVTFETQHTDLPSTSNAINEPISLVHVKLIDKAKEKTFQVDKSRESPENNEDYPVRSSVTPERFSPKRQNVNRNPIDTPLNIVVAEPSKPTLPRIFIRSATGDESSLESPPQTELPEDNSKELKITESTENITGDASTIEATNSEKYKIKFVALKSFSPEPIRKKDVDPHLPNHAFTTKPVPPERRRSVKDIIESINKSQSLLKINQDAIKNKAQTMNEQQKANDENGCSLEIQLKQMPNNSASANNVETTDEREFTKIIEDFGEPDNNYSSPNDIPVMVERFDEFNNNNNEDLFGKCTYRQDAEKLKTGKSNLDWNPVPKPRRSKNMASDYDIEK